MTPDQYCQQKAAGSGSSFTVSFLFLEPGRRRAITALYAFCREVDDIVDDGADPVLAQTQLDGWRAEIEALFSGQPKHPVSRALADALVRFDLPREHFLEIIAGMEMDLTQHRYADFAALKHYCYRVASVVGLAAAEIFGYQDPKTLDYAHDLGLALQLTNIIRDVGEDARRGRIYLPRDELARFEVPEADLVNGRYSAQFQRLMEFQIERAAGYYDRALAQLPRADRKAQRAGLMMAAIYRALLDKIRQDGCRVLDQRTTLSSPRKLWLAWTTWLRA
ncbi:All-trans-phytoene synthase [mine drainage metagenome]|uniref:All-trans-phytoene synthase n=1 Tax=mine drainage metagenome TaxID=410659 RepID=A0A1J5RT64_9ZZZZ